MPTEIPSLWRPLRTPTFRNLLVADVVSDIGTFMQAVGAAWLMVSLNAGPLYVALIQTASSLPFFLFALPAGAIGDIVDRRKLILISEIWMVTISLVISILTIGRFITPLPLLILTFALSAGDAFESPSWRAILPDLVQKADLQAASALNGIEFNFARAVGPGLAGLVIAVAGVGTAFLLNTISFIGVIFIVARWKRAIPSRTTPPETVLGATVAAVRYVRYSSGIRSVLVRAGVLMFFASALLALLPSLARALKNTPATYGLLFGCFGIGAVCGALALQRARARWSTEAVVSYGIVVFGVSMLAAAIMHSIVGLGTAMFLAGSAWVLFLSTFNVIVLNQAPNWVRARSIAIYTLVFQGALAAGSATWGTIAARVGVHRSLLYAGLGCLSATALTLVLRLPTAPLDLAPGTHWRMPVIANESLVDENHGPVLVTVEYEVAEAHSVDFLKSAQKYGKVRRRDGARRWSIFRDIENPNHFVEIFIVSSWAEHLRQHERFTQADRQIEDSVFRFASSAPKVRHLIFVS